MKSGFRLSEINFNLDNSTQSSKKIFEKKRVTLFSMSQNFETQNINNKLKDFENSYDRIKKLGIHEIYYCALENFFILKSKFNEIKINNIKILPDEKGIFTEHLGMLSSKKENSEKQQDKNYMAIITDGIIEKWWEDISKSKNEERETYFTKIRAENCLEYLHGSE